MKTHPPVIFHVVLQNLIAAIEHGILCQDIDDIPDRHTPHGVDAQWHWHWRGSAPRRRANFKVFH